MKKFVCALLTNRLGIILATLNVCYFVGHVNKFPLGDFEKFFSGQNFPALLPTFITLKFLEILFPFSCYLLENYYAPLVFSFFMVWQWLFIGWSAKIIARKIQRA